MEPIIELTKIDYVSVFVAVFTILVGIRAMVSIFEWGINKFGLETKWMRKKREEHDLLIKTAQNLTELQKKHTEDVKQSIIHDDRIREEFSEFMNEIRNTVTKTQDEIKQFAENRVHDREQSIKIQKELTNSIKGIISSNCDKDRQIDNLIAAQREVLADKINQKYKYYISIEGIPEDEVDEFTNIHKAYKAIGGNHSGDAKYEYCMNHLQVIPVETKLIFRS